MTKSYLKGSMELLVLRCLRDNKLHGYAILEKLRVAGKGYFAGSEGNLYPLLAKLEQDKLVKSSWDERRRNYELTTRGRRRLDAEAKQWQTFSQTMADFLFSTEYAAK